MAESKMKCPFRTDENGEFKDCYGERCMAHFYVPGPWSVKPEGGYWQASIPSCKRLMCWISEEKRRCEDGRKQRAEL